ncbi:phosphatidylserine/phosphatidylglycerophosphate/cardiolipin synthase-like enzyme [Caulobacter ginsengisoli]|uniref:Phospholipase D n=1 Tax=Caulobacter ginsengisoli TaxID=400775 RepID=A0ABU0IXA8_9CAUL|nr:phospholipase D-like domain-containing protein [Caulobacter ginsengisoli]MDQ0466653.1 phosphatidylserine/phosphatidylglycerophosphate/cardiolipin synthase-like enzyme [Caulobacter ginsengisoli]
MPFVADDRPILREGDNCWRLAMADRVAMLIDCADYFAAAKAAILQAKHSIWLLAWVFDPLTRLTPDQPVRSSDPEHADRLGLLLLRLATLNPALDVRVLTWDMPLPIAASQLRAPQRGVSYFAGSRVKFRLDNTLPGSACHHQKILVIDGRVAFLSGGDLGVDRWDTVDHTDRDPRRRRPDGRSYPPRHEVSMVVDGPAAQMLAEQFALRWKRATGETPPDPPDMTEDDHIPWPPDLAPDLRQHPVALARTDPRWKDNPGVRECLELHLAAIAKARNLIYLENQYLTSPVIVAALKRRLGELDGPEVVTVHPMHSPSYFDQMTMDSARTWAIGQLKKADRYGRFSAFTPRTPQDQLVIIHSKVAIIDDDFLRIGSANLNNRSLGLDSECDLALEAIQGPKGMETRAVIRAFRDRLVGHYMHRHPGEVSDAEDALGGLATAINGLDDGPCRCLPPFEVKPLTKIQKFIVRWRLGDPLATDDAWRPWIRNRRVEKALAEVAARPDPVRPPKAGGPRRPAPSRRRATRR